MSYQAEEIDPSTFNITLDLGRDAPTVDATVDSWDGGPTQEDVGLRITEPATNADAIAYSIQRAATFSVGTVCDPGAAYGETATARAVPSPVSTHRPSTQVRLAGSSSPPANPTACTAFSA